MNFEPWDDMFSFNAELLDNNFNDDKQFILNDSREFGTYEVNTSI